MKKKRVFTAQWIGRGYDRITPKVMEQLDIEDSFQSLRTEPIGIMYDHIMEVAGIRDNMRILDAGCGIGGPSLYFANHRQVDIEALNISKVQVEVFRAKVGEQNLGGRINITHGDYHKLDEYYPSSHFDVIVFLESFGHGAEPARMLKTAFKVLKSGGRVYIKEPLRICKMDPLKWRKVKKARELLSNHYGYKFNTRREVRNLLAEAGFRNIVINEFSLPNANLNLNLVFQYESIANLSFFGRGQSPEFFGIKYFDVTCIK